MNITSRAGSARPPSSMDVVFAFVPEADRPLSLEMTMAQMPFPGHGIVDQYPYSEQKRYSKSCKHDGIHGLISSFFRFGNHSSNEGNQETNDRNDTNPYRAFFEEEADEASPQNDLGKACEHPSQPNTFFRTQKAFHSLSASRVQCTTIDVLGSRGPMENFHGIFRWDLDLRG